MEITLGWLGMIIGLIGFVGLWGWLLNAIGEDLDAKKEQKKKGP